MHKITFLRVAIAGLLSMFLVAPLLALVKGPDAGGYVATDSAVYSFVDLTALGGASVLAGVDDGVAALTLPFGFRFYGQTYTVACVSSNGAVYFVSAAQACVPVTDFANIDLGLNTPNDWPAAFPLWMDLTFQHAGAGAVVYQSLGSPGNRRFVIQWNNAYPVGLASPVTFEAILTETTNDVLFQYKAVSLAQNGALATVGVRNSGGNANNQQIQWSFKAPVIKDNTAVLFSGADADAPVITVNATPTSLWPANKQTVSVQVTGRITDTSGVASASYSVADSYSQLQPSGTITLAGDGTYAFTLSLIADRNGNDKVGRTYAITVRARDRAGNTSSAVTTVVVPHDQR